MSSFYIKKYRPWKGATPAGLKLNQVRFKIATVTKIKGALHETDIFCSLVILGSLVMFSDLWTRNRKSHQKMYFRKYMYRKSTRDQRMYQGSMF